MPKFYGECTWSLLFHLCYLYGVSETKDKDKLLCLNRSWLEKLPCLDGYSITYGCAQTLGWQMEGNYCKQKGACHYMLHSNSL